MKIAPDFELCDQYGVKQKLSNYRGVWVVLYFYPYDKSLNCRKEACTFRDEYRIIVQFGNAKVLGVNKGSIESHKKFSKRNHLNFPILSDPGHKVTSMYGAWRTQAATLLDKPFGTRRNTYLINPEGKIVKSYLGVNPATHAQEVIIDLRALQDKHNLSSVRKEPGLTSRQT